jgi:hypothetical protein
MKSSEKLKEKLRYLLRGYSGVKVRSSWPWNDLEFREIAWVVQDYVNNSGEVVNEDPLHEWVEEYNFFRSETKS